MPNGNPDFASLVSLVIGSVFSPLTGLLIGAAVVYFLAGVLKYVRQVSDDKAREEGRKMMLYGIVALFVMISVWGLVNVLRGTFLLEDYSPPVPDFRGLNQG